MKALVTGGGGFLGQAIVRLLLERGDKVRSFSRRDYPELAALGVEQCQGELADPPRLVSAAAEGCDIVFHVAAKAGIWGAYEDFYRANVVGTQNVIAACRRHGIGRLVYTSSPSVVFDGRDMEGVMNRSLIPSTSKPIIRRPRREPNSWCCAANDAELATVALRPHLIWGPGDNHLVPRILARGRAGRTAPHRRPPLSGRYDLHRQRRRGPSAGRRTPRPRFAGRRQGLLPRPGGAAPALGDGQPHPRCRRPAAGDPQHLPPSAPTQSAGLWKSSIACCASPASRA